MVGLSGSLAPGRSSCGFTNLAQLGYLFLGLAGWILTSLAFKVCARLFWIFLTDFMTGGECAEGTLFHLDLHSHLAGWGSEARNNSSTLPHSGQSYS